MHDTSLSWDPQDFQIYNVGGRSRADTTHAAVWTALQALILGALVQDTVVRASIDLLKTQHHWSGQLLYPITIDRHNVILWKQGTKETQYIAR